MQDNNKQNQLLQLRSEIDKIDDKIIKLLNKRIEIVKEVGSYKTKIKDKFFIKSAREADMIKNLLEKTDKKIPQSVIVNIWRKIITSSNVLEQNLKIGIYNPNKIADYKYLIREYYGDFVPLKFYDSTNNIISGLEKGQIQIAIFALPNKDKNLENDWWIKLANNQNNIKIFASIPFINNDNFKLVAAAVKNAEKSQKDKTILSIEVNQEISQNEIKKTLEKSDLKPMILQSAKLPMINDVQFYLLEIDGFVDEKSKEIKELEQGELKPFIKILGHFPIF